MNDRKYILIENEGTQIVNYQKFLADSLVNPNSIWPQGNSTGVHSWAAAGQRMIQLKDSGFNPELEKIVLILDLALDELDSNALAGIEWIRSNFNFLQAYVVVVSTKSVDHAISELKEKFDAILSKRELSVEDRPIAYFRRIINEAVIAFEKRKGQTQNINLLTHCEIKDSQNLQLFESTFGKLALPDLIKEIARQGHSNSKPRVLMATGGYSGAFVVLFDFKIEGKGSRQVAVKVSKNKQDLEEEVSKLEDALAASHKFAEMPSASLQKTKQLPGFKDVYLFTQHFHDGNTLEAEILDNPIKLDFMPFLKNSLEVVTRHGFNDSQEINLSKKLIFSQEDEFRFQTSIRCIKQLLVSLNGHDRFKKLYEKSIDKLLKLEDVEANWTNYVESNFQNGIAYEQHGDLNPRNILLLREKNIPSQIKLIDFARFGVWPAFYDLTRLRLQLALRLLDPPDTMRDQFIERIFMWQNAWDGKGLPNIKTFADAAHPFKAFNDINKIILRIIEESILIIPKNRQQETKKNIDLIILHELIKMISYQDASWIKRLWFCLLAADKAVLIFDDSN